ncbi:alpha/beta hydrolase domain-containing protein [Mycobacterium saskatchewanense]|uniref:Alpha/beta hydrolase domain-containing protein n=1 Tax=Mycobacterium saskatchewanense TaxID=220927 RepID=A0AAJ3NSF2_9MYCO|nr:alpha/beta hydrolase domain-containing protein [Mycobacterium saskatchewanense]ORW73882.1 hypothetical protein AWC23_00810 [Mycobacterium saskatchewanense]
MTESPSVTLAPGKPLILLGAFDIGDVGYVAEEFFISGTARSVTPGDAADYTTRMVVLTPDDPARFNGTVLVEWLNVSGGIDAPAVWMMAHREVVRSGYAYVAVSVQRVGVEGGASMLAADMSLKRQDPARYGALHHPGDGYAYDIFTQAGETLKYAERHGISRLSRARSVIAVGESQSAMFLTTYINAVDPLAQTFDGFLVHSRFGSAAPLDGSSIFAESGAAQPVPFRPDLRVPVMTVITETDLFGAAREGYYFARQPDNDRLRVWEIPGAAHADNYTIQVAPIDSGTARVDDLAAAYAPTNVLMGQRLSHYINFAPQHHYVLQAALDALNAWVRTGAPPPEAPPLDVTDSGQPMPVLDANGLALGGVRTPWVDVPIARTSGFGGDDSVMSAIFGSGEPFDAATLNRLYPDGAAEYLARFGAALDAAIQAGFILPADREEILALAAATYRRGESSQA